MLVEVSCREIGIEGCDFVASGEETQVLEDMVVHARQAHGFDIPEDVRERSMTDLQDPERMIWSRIQRAAKMPDQAP